jgi:hypothetical protein
MRIASVQLLAQHRRRRQHPFQERSACSSSGASLIHFLDKLSIFDKKEVDIDQAQEISYD